MNTTSSNATKRILFIQLFAMLMAVGLYYGLTYIAQPGRNPLPHTRTFLNGFLGVTALIFLVGMVVERAVFARAKTAHQIATSGVVSAVFGEAIGICGLLWFFLSGERVWGFFAVSALYFVRLFARLPEFNARIDELSQ